MSSEKYKQAIEELWNQAAAICNYNHHWRPDVNLVLMHSAIGPYLAANELWGIHFGGDLPNTVFSNIGREKIRFYEDRPRPGVTSWFVADYEDVENLGHFRAWMSYQQNWIESLKGQIEAVIGSKPPARILVIDDFHHEGVTSSITYALLELLYPKSEVLFSTTLSTDSWKYVYLPWVGENFPAYLEMEDKEERKKVTSAFYKLMAGTEDIDPDSLDYKSIDAQSEIIAPLLNYAPAEKWLSLIEWSRGEIARNIQSKAHEYDPKDFNAKRLSSRVRDWDLSVQILRDIWLQGSVSIRECMQKYGLSYYRISKVIKSLIRDYKVVMPFGKGRYTRYTLDPRELLEMQSANITEFIEYLDFTRRGN